MKKKISKIAVASVLAASVASPSVSFASEGITKQIGKEFQKSVETSVNNGLVDYETTSGSSVDSAEEGLFVNDTKVTVDADGNATINVEPNSTIDINTTINTLTINGNVEDCAIGGIFIDEGANVNTINFNNNVTTLESIFSKELVDISKVISNEDININTIYYHDISTEQDISFDFSSINVEYIGMSDVTAHSISINDVGSVNLVNFQVEENVVLNNVDSSEYESSSTIRIRGDIGGTIELANSNVFTFELFGTVGGNIKIEETTNVEYTELSSAADAISSLSSIDLLTKLDGDGGNISIILHLLYGEISQSDIDKLKGKTISTLEIETLEIENQDLNLDFDGIIIENYVSFKGITANSITVSNTESVQFLRCNVKEDITLNKLNIDDYGQTNGCSFLGINVGGSININNSNIYGPTVDGVIGESIILNSSTIDGNFILLGNSDNLLELIDKMPTTNGVTVSFREYVTQEDIDSLKDKDIDSISISYIWTDGDINLDFANIDIENVDIYGIKANSMTISNAESVFLNDITTTDDLILNNIKDSDDHWISSLIQGEIGGSIQLNNSDIFMLQLGGTVEENVNLNNTTVGEFRYSGDSSYWESKIKGASTGNNNSNGGNGSNGGNTSTGGSNVTPPTVSKPVITTPDAKVDIKDGGSINVESSDKVQNITFPTDIKTIGDVAIAKTPNLETITFPESVTSLGNLKVSETPKLVSLDLPKNLTKIDSLEVANASQLETIALPQSLATIGDLKVSEAPKLGSVEIPTSVTEIKSLNLANTAVSSVASILDRAKAGTLKVTGDVFVDNSFLDMSALQSLSASDYSFFKNLQDGVAHKQNKLVIPTNVATHKLATTFASSDLAVGDTFTVNTAKETQNYNGTKEVGEATTSAFAEGDLVYTSSNPSVATVDTNGKVTVVGTGDFAITVSVGANGEGNAKVITETYAVPANISFSDVKNSHWAYDTINDIASLGLVSGYPDGTFKPNNKMQRDEIVSVLAKWLEKDGKLPATATISNPYSDVATTHWNYDNILKLSELGILSGKGNGVFAPDAELTRGEMAVILVNVLDLELSSTTPAFSDVSSDHWAAKYIQTLYENGLVNGTGGNKFEPNKSMTRAECAKFIMNAIEVK